MKDKIKKLTKNLRRGDVSQSGGKKLHPKKIYGFRLAALIGVPIGLVVALEMVLRLAGFGYPTAFLLPSENHGKKTFVQNNKFGWRFFGPRMARLPESISFPRVKPAGTVRIFVFGESAAFGDPQPGFGLPRMLQAMLEARHPGVKFEVINAAMTGINSYAIVPIARDCAGAGGDIWVIYMGNNEVVGPFGAGSIFGLPAAPLAVIRASLELKTTRIGQLGGLLLGALHPAPPSKSEWGGMKMFLDTRLRKDSPRMTTVYHNFAGNLADIIRAGRDHGAGVVISTVAVNLSDCAPFASLHRPDLSFAQLGEWQTNFNRGVAAQRDGQFFEAQNDFKLAAKIDESFAELRFRLGQCAQALGDPAAALGQLAAARDLDALRFRCDSQLNELIRAAAIREGNGVRLADAEEAFANASPKGLPGADLFYEHVHLTFAGNFVLARTIAEQVETLLPPTGAPTNLAWPEITECAQRLAFTDRAEQQAVSEILGRRTDPPFTWQINHAAEMQRFASRLRSLPPASSERAISEAEAVCEAAIAKHPDNPQLLEELAELKLVGGDPAGAVATAKQTIETLPSSAAAWSLLGHALAQQQDFAGAADAFQQSIGLDSQDVWARQNYAICLRKQNRRQEAIREFKKTLAIKPRFGLAWLGIGQTYEEMGRTNEALACYEKAVANPVHRGDELTTLARFCQSRNWLQAAATNFEEAITLSPSDARLRREAGHVLASLNRPVDAAQCFAEAGQLEPDSGEAHYLSGLEWGLAGKPAEAEKEFREAVRIWPDLAEAHINLGIALYHQHKLAEAGEAFAAGLKRDSKNATALKYLQELQALRPRP
jgi:tetratricopeptide (TPR) repeat protein